MFSSTTVIHRTVMCLILANSLLLCVQSAGPGRQRRPRRELIAETGPTDEHILESGLVEKSLTAALLYEKGRQYYQQTAVKRFSGPVLAYVTPWHKDGYEFAVNFRAKLTHVSPVWYQLKRVEKIWTLEGGHEYNKTWVDQVRSSVGQGGNTTKVVPRVIVEVQDPQDHVDLVLQPVEAAYVLLKEILDKDYDGIVLEVWMTWAMMNGMSNDQFSEAALAAVKTWSEVLHSADGRPRIFAMAVPPPVPQSYGGPAIDAKHLRQFSPYVDLWSIMTYDYALEEGPRPNAPLTWLNMQHKVMFGADDGPVVSTPSQALMGINFYGYSYNLKDRTARGEAIIASTMLSILAKQQPVIEWDDEQGEHHFEYEAPSGTQRVFYPTPRSMELRLELFSQWGTGLSIWELGQGLERFFDLL